VRGGEYSFETDRLEIAEWHDQAERVGADTSLPRIVIGLLTPKVTEPLPEQWHGSYTETRATQWIRDRDREGTQLLVVAKESGDPVGLVLVHEEVQSPAMPTSIRVGYLVSEALWGNGFASEILQGLVEWAATRGYHSIIAGVADTNLPSIRVLEKCGFARVETAGGPAPFYSLEV